MDMNDKRKKNESKASIEGSQQTRRAGRAGRAGRAVKAIANQASKEERLPTRDTPVYNTFAPLFESANGNEASLKRMRYRVVKNKIFTISCYTITFLAILPLALILFYVLREGVTRLDLNLFTRIQPGPGSSTGGILNAITGTIMLVTVATLIASPIAILAGVYLSFQKNTKLSEIAYIANNILQSIPAIVFGIVVYSWVVVPMGGFSMISGSIALALMMLPYITISTVEVIKMIPAPIIEAGHALGGSHTKVVLRVVLPLVAPGIVTSIILALSRVAGEAAPLLFTAFGNPYVSFYFDEPISSLPSLIFQFSIAPYETWKQLAWSASLILILFIITANFLSKWLTRNSAKL